MKRRAFLGSITGPVVAACAVCMGACSKTTGGDSFTSGGVSANFNVDLLTNITTVGSSILQNGIVIVRLATGNVPASFTAVQAACTHQGTFVSYNQAANKFICPNHGANFSTTGAVTQGPATNPLKVYVITISGSTMTVIG
jgi:cytochrome b6-f complex iron-sulfur subunit